MRVNLNKLAEQIVPEYSLKQFVDNVSEVNISPLYRGVLRTFYPTTIKEQKSKRRLTRYIFNYNANGSFNFITARRGQRNGGNNITLSEEQVSVIITDPANNFAVLKDRKFNKIFDNLYTFGQVTRIIYVNQIYYWQERLPGSPLFTSLYYSSPTQNALDNADKEGDVNWFEVGTDKYVIANNSKVVFYNNNTLAGLNGWPIKNEEILVKTYSTQDGQGVNNINETLIKETRPEMLDDAYLHKCFCNVRLDSYDTVFVEVLWKEYTNKTKFKPSSNLWIGESFTVPVLKGRVYRVGTLAKSNEVNNYDIVTFAQRTKIKTTRAKRGGNTVFN
jgi:hypothetical protein